MTRPILTKYHLVCALILLVFTGCSKAPEPVPQLSRPAAEAFLGALLTADQKGILQSLDPQARAYLLEQGDFPGRLAQRKRLMAGNPERYKISSLSETKGEARLHVVWLGGNLKNSFKEAFVLKEHKGSWGVVLGERWYAVE